jgi:bacterioferritin
MATFIKDIEEIRQRAIEKIEDGPVTAAYRGDKEKSIEILNEALATEIVCVLRYMHHYFMATGVHGRSVADEFKEHADEEREHADLIGERIQQLGGKPNFNPGSLIQRSVTQYVEGETLADMIREDLIAERMVIEVYGEMIRFFGNNDPTTRRMIEHILAQEEEHAADLSDLLYIVDPETGETEGRDPGTDPLALRRQVARFGGQLTTDDVDYDEEEEYLEVEPVSTSSRERRPNPKQDLRGRDREYDGTQRTPSAGGKLARSQKDAVASIGITNADRKQPKRSNLNAEVSTGGVSGRPMNRRRDIEDDDVAPRQPARTAEVGGMSGGTRSSKILQKNRKNKRIA